VFWEVFTNKLVLYVFKIPRFFNTIRKIWGGKNQDQKFLIWNFFNNLVLYVFRITRFFNTKRKKWEGKSQDQKFVIWNIAFSLVWDKTFLKSRLKCSQICFSRQRDFKIKVTILSFETKVVPRWILEFDIKSNVAHFWIRKKSFKCTSL